MGEDTILEDGRKILYIERMVGDADGNHFAWSTKEGRWKNCDAIRAYPEPGQMAMVPWFAVYRDGVVIARVPAHFVEVGYVAAEEK